MSAKHEHDLKISSLTTAPAILRLKYPHHNP
jgi:hypothetical protein